MAWSYVDDEIVGLGHDVRAPRQGWSPTPQITCVLDEIEVKQAFGVRLVVENRVEEAGGVESIGRQTVICIALPVGSIRCNAAISVGRCDLTDGKSSCQEHGRKTKLCPTTSESHLDFPHRKRMPNGWFVFRDVNARIAFVTQRGFELLRIDGAFVGFSGF